MYSFIEKLAAIEKEVAAIQPKMAPLTERIADLDQKVAGFAQQLTGIAGESVAVKQDIELTRQSLTRIQTLIGESKAESEQLVAGQEENLQRCETMTAVFGAAFQAVSQFFETAQRMGLADQAKAIFLNPSMVQTADGGRQMATEALPEPQSSPSESQSEDRPASSILSESDFDSITPDSGSPISAEWSVPDLPNVTDPPEMDAVNSYSEADPEPSSEIASQLEVPPLNLSTPSLPEPSEPPPADETDDQEIEALLAAMTTPVTATAGELAP